MGLFRLFQPVLVLAFYSVQFANGLPEPRQEGSQLKSLPLKIVLPPDIGKPIPRNGVVKKWAAFGDSYASGIGAGVRQSDTGDWTCSRYSEAYPSFLNKDLDGADAKTRKFFNFACSGSVTTVVKDNQVNGFEPDIDIATLSVGGNDIGFFNVVNNCIFQFWITTPCEQQIQITQGIIDSITFHKNLDDVIGAILARAFSPHFRLYMSGYAQFFNSITSQCNGVTWSYWQNRKNKPYLTQAFRQQLNTLTTNLNNAIQQAIDRANIIDQRRPVVFVDINDHFAGHRFCELEVTEPDPNNPNTLFFEWNSNKVTEDHNGPEVTPIVGPVTQASKAGPESQPTQAAKKSEEQDQSPNEPIQNLPGIGEEQDSISALYASWVQKQHDEDTTLLTAMPLPAESGGPQGSFPPHWWFDNLAKAFHPKPSGHRIIEDQILAAYGTNPPPWGGIPIPVPVSIKVPEPMTVGVS